MAVYREMPTYSLTAPQVQSRGRERLARALLLEWKQAALVSQPAQRLADLAAARRARQLLAGSFGAWHSACTLRQAQRAAMARFAQRQAARRCSAALAAWWQQAQCARCQLARLEGFMQRWAWVSHIQQMLYQTPAA